MLVWKKRDRQRTDVCQSGRFVPGNSKVASSKDRNSKPLFVQPSAAFTCSSVIYRILQPLFCGVADLEEMVGSVSVLKRNSNFRGRVLSFEK
ncbi:hypothetical protein L596_001057 [Steinernema carpocapsae]|uniref:Uncharacterized protein n=1 Tax=Steinernema carpocapsae TaxID=34508 RepID=A0A4U8UP54_STECR|nr:hypothetical protein L596_001057 [Steinernema carpocapsae]